LLRIPDTATRDFSFVTKSIKATGKSMLVKVA
jgi:hypothetical protein